MTTYGSVCSGIESASVAWEPLGFKPSWFSEIELFPSAVLANHWPHVDNLGDMAKITDMLNDGVIHAPDILVGGTPCQAFSVAGKRESLDDSRGQLTLEFVRIANAIDKRRRAAGLGESVIVWENVPGVLSTKDNAFGCFLGELSGSGCELQPSGKKWGNAGCVLGPQRAVAWRVIDAQYFGVAQRRRRVFVVASARDGFDPSKVLFESEGVRRDTPPSREKGQGFAADVAPSLVASGRGVERIGETRGQDPVVAQTYQEISHCLNAGGMGRIDYETESFIVHGTQDPCVSSDKAFELGRNNGAENALFHATGAGYWQPGAGTLRAREQDSHENLCLPINTQIITRGGALGKNTGFGLGAKNDPAYTLQAAHSHGVFAGLRVRRLTPVECERLQGFPDNHTQIPWRGKQPEDCPDGPRYKAIGNSKAVPCIKWIGERIKRELGDG